MINLITGLPGSGKTLYTLKTVRDYADKENKALLAQGKPPRQVYYHGIPELNIPNWQLMESPEDWINLPSHSIIVIDECQSTFRPRAASVKPPPYIAEFETHRHKGLDFFLLTQHPMLVDGNIRRLAGKHYHVVRFYGFPKSTIHEFQSVRDNVDKNLKNSIETHFVYPKEVYNWYKSADAHTVKKRIPMRMVMVVVLPILLVVVSYYAFQSLSDIKDKPSEFSDKIKNGDSAAAGSGGLGSAASGGGQPAKLTYIAAHTPEVEDFAFTAPAYQEIVKPVTAPFPAACVQSKSKGCKCYTQQGTAYPVAENVCVNIVKNGFFVEWQNPQASPERFEMSEQEQARASQVIPDNPPIARSGIIKGETLDVDQQPRHVNLNLPPQDASLRFQY